MMMPRIIALATTAFVLLFFPIKSSIQWSAFITENSQFLLSRVQSPEVAIGERIVATSSSISAVSFNNQNAELSKVAEVSYFWGADDATSEITKLNQTAQLIPGSQDDINLLQETNISFLWSADASPEIRKHNLRQLKVIQVSLVVSHCDKPLDWILEYFAPPNKSRGLRKFQMLNYTIQVDRIQIFTKCGGNQTQMDSFMQRAQKHLTSSEISITNLPNVGRCDHTYAYWLQQYMLEQQQKSKNGENDVVLFLKDNNHRTQLRQSLTHLSLQHVVGNAVTSGFSCFEQEKMSVLRKTQSRPMKAVYHKSNYHSLDELRQFYMEEYQREEKRDIQDDFHSNYTTMGSWLDDLGFKLYGSVRWENTTLIPLCIGGMFAATTGQIRKNSNDWSKLVHSLERGNNIVEGHFCERSWAALLSSPLDQSQVDQIGSFIQHKITFKGNPWHPIPGRMYAGEVDNPKRYRKDQSGLLLPCCNQSTSSASSLPA